MEEDGTKHEMLSGGQAAAAAHSLGTPLTIKIYYSRIIKTIKNNKEVIQDIELLESQVERCNQILKIIFKLNQEDDFIDEDLSMKEYLKEIIFRFKNKLKTIYSEYRPGF